MKRLKKVILLPLRSLAYRRNHLKLYYWSDQALYELRNVHLMPDFYYRWLFRFSMRMVHIARFRRFADKAIHTIPYRVRFDVA
ncbi:hypothetical protein DSCA_08150 [Desulfosarcina alkanivorans]|uniref:Uncharacterized protein n=1 Tax=Desulfosarcina alkanivorans TaxID=571177 RepID=A0A5K7YEM6_9BACT|nr:hypothetical protein [Desulfosarcina alkanivorans]BBO66885.1 hypothetical protein DSCA_08150 [Desulfosarcina alkanivorans]